MPIHHPPHIFIDHTYYFLTARTVRWQRIFYTDTRKALLLSSLKAAFHRRGYKLKAWVILDEHYHILFQTKKGKDLSSIINEVHGRVSFILNKQDQTRGRRIFHNYWDRCIRDQRDFNTHINYIHITIQ